MKLCCLPQTLAVCKLEQAYPARPEELASSIVFWAKTPGEQSLVCDAACVPKEAVQVEGPFRAFYVEGPLDFSLVGILAELSALLAAESISIFAVSTYDTDYILVKEAQFEKAKQVLQRQHEIIERKENL